MVGLVLITLLTVANPIGLLIPPGLWLKAHYGPDILIVLVFFFSGLALNTGQVRKGFADYKGTILALILTFAVAPLVALAISILPIETGVILGLLLVSAMPSTLSSGVVMTGAAGGNLAHALLITIIGNSLAVVTIPVTLGLLFSLTGESRIIEINQIPMMITIATRVLLPLLTGLIVRNITGSKVQAFLPYTGACNQTSILVMVWMALCGGRPAILEGLDSIHVVVAIAFFYHLILIVAGLVTTRFFAIGKGRRESVVLMGGQKTLPLSVILQVSLFPDYGIALVVCVLHHIIHLIMDAFLIRYLKEME